MSQSKSLKTAPASSLTIFKIRNRKGYAAICKENLTEGRTPYQAYQRMNKALKRMGLILKDLTAQQVQKIIKKTK